MSRILQPAFLYRLAKTSMSPQAKVLQTRTDADAVSLTDLDLEHCFKLNALENK